MTTGEKIKARRNELKMTTETLGQMIGVQRSAISKYESGKVDPKSKRLQQIAAALGVPPASLLPDSGKTEEERLIAAYWNAEPTYREIAMDILIQHPKKNTEETAIS